MFSFNFPVFKCFLRVRFSFTSRQVIHMIGENCTFNYFLFSFVSFLLFTVCCLECCKKIIICKIMDMLLSPYVLFCIIIIVL